jgi:nicotinate-nucleotide pyrophosphorylase (carboxylating)
MANAAMSYAEQPRVVELVRLALREDIGDGDVTSQSCIPADRQAFGQWRAKQDLVLAGVSLLPLVFAEHSKLYGSSNVNLEIERTDGDALKKGDRIGTVVGTAQILLECERLSLNLLQRLSGVATLSRRYAHAVSHTKCKVLDTRKTTPGLRLLEKAAVKAGGGVNHRIGLFDAILIKNNHIDAAGGVTKALKAALATGKPVEIEIRNRQELDEALSNGATHVMLDNLTPDQARVEIAYIAGRAKVELSGGINLQTVASYAETGADFVSCGAMTHSATAVDINFRIEWR